MKEGIKEPVDEFQEEPDHLQITLPPTMWTLQITASIHISGVITHKEAHPLTLNSSKAGFLGYGLRTSQQVVAWNWNMQPTDEEGHPEMMIKNPVNGIAWKTWWPSPTYVNTPHKSLAHMKKATLKP